MLLNVQMMLLNIQNVVIEFTYVVSECTNVVSDIDTIVQMLLPNTVYICCYYIFANLVAESTNNVSHMIVQMMLMTV